jgi:hypothetical protein
MLADSLPAKVMKSLNEGGLYVLARVPDEGCVDLAIALSPTSLAVIRCVERASEADHHALKTMLAQGDFTRAALVYIEGDQPHLSDEIESYPLSRIDELAASLARESAK